MGRSGMSRKTEDTEEIRYVKRTEEGYPEILNYYERMPEGLYLKGNFPDPEKKTVAMIGARNCSNYGRVQALQFAERLAEEGVQIISGMAYGIDTYALQGALKSGGKAFAVLGCGADVCYPKENYYLYEEIYKKDGGIISEFEPGSPPLSWHFPIRNRIISALADIVLVVEARKKSGSLITTDYALEQGKSVYAVPGRVGDACSTGCNALIAQGAGIAWTPEVLLEELFAGSAGEKCRGEAVQTRKQEMLSPEEQKVYKCLQTTEQSVDSISRASGLESRLVAASLTVLCMEGLAVSRSPGFYCRLEEWE